MAVLLDASRQLPQRRGVPLAWRNLFANKRRLLRSSAGIAFAALLMMVELGFEQGFFEASLSAVEALDGDLFVESAYKYRFGTRDPIDHGELDKVRAVAGIASAAPLYADWQDFFWTSPLDGKPYLVRVFAFDPAAPPVFSLAAINGQRVQIAGSFALGPDFMSDGTVVMSDRLFAKLLPGYRGGVETLPIEAIAIKLGSGASAAAVQSALEAALPNTSVVMTKAELVDFERKFQEELSSAGPIFWLGAIVGFVVGMLISY